MSRKLSSLFEDADAIVSKMATQTKVAQPTGDGEIQSQVEWLRTSGTPIVKEAKAVEPELGDVIQTLTEKLAHAKAFLETYVNLPALLKMDQFEKAASAKGYSEDQIETYFEKNASEFALKSVL
jgi:hypothetical protein